MREEQVKLLLKHKTESEKRRAVLEAIETAIKSGFYAGQAMAGVELEDCHQNYKRWNLPVKKEGEMK